MNNDTRRRDTARVHAVTRELKLESGSAPYCAWMKRHTGKTSCADLTDAELAALADSLKATLPQWQMVSQLTRELGYSGFEDEKFRTIVKRVTKADDARLLSRPQLGKLTAVLVKSVTAKRKRAQSAAAAGADATDRRPVGPVPPPPVAATPAGGPPDDKAPA